MKCPNCSNAMVSRLFNGRPMIEGTAMPVSSTVYQGMTVQRTRQCMACGQQFHTSELPIAPGEVVELTAKGIVSRKR